MPNLILSSSRAYLLKSEHQNFLLFILIDIHISRFPNLHYVT